MATIDAISGPSGAQVPSPAKPTWLRSNWSVLLAVAALVTVIATALASAMIPIAIAVLEGVATPGINIVGMTMLLQFVVSFGFILLHRSRAEGLHAC